MAAKDLQISRTKPIRADELKGVPNAYDNGGSSASPEFFLRILARQWPLLFIAGVASGAIAWFVSLEFVKESVTVDLELKSQALPVANQSLYGTPSADVASEWLTSSAVLQPVVEKHGLPPVPYFVRQLSVRPNAKSGSILVVLEHADNSASAILDDLGNEFLKVISEHRRQTLTKHASHVSQLLLDADRDLSNARAEFIRLKDSQQPTGDESRNNAELQGVITRKIQVETALEQNSQSRGKILRSQSVVLQDIAAIRSSVLRVVLTGRQKQANGAALGLTKASRAAAVKQQILQQLQRLEVELASLLPSAQATRDLSDRPAVDAIASVGKSSSKAPEPLDPEPARTADESQGGVQAVAGGGVPQTNDGTPGFRADEISREVDDVLTKWIATVSAVGKETLGELDADTVISIQKAKDALARLAVEARRLQFEFDDNKIEMDFLQSKARDLENAMGSSKTKALSTWSERALELETQLSLKEGKYAELSRQLDQINQVKDCQWPEYVVQRSANLVADGEKSNRNKLFVLAFLGSGLFLLIPSVVIELFRLRPTPVSFVSRKWNLPVLGSQASSHPSRKAVPALSAEFQHEFRLMALRIQQSLFRPEGRVVLFSGLDHEESPMGLIRTLAKCFSQREESVLIIQTLPTPSEAGETTPRRVGVAEFLSGKCEDATELVVGTGFPGIAFLPGGCATGASEAMASSRLTSLINQFRESYSIILLCGPSTLHPADLQMLAARADGIVFTVNRQSMRSVYGDEVINDLLELGVPILGFAEQPKASRKAFPSDPFPGVKETNSEMSLIETSSEISHVKTVSV